MRRHKNGYVAIHEYNKKRRLVDKGELPHWITYCSPDEACRRAGLV